MSSMNEWLWDEEALSPAADAEMRQALIEAMEKFADLLPPSEEDTCQCFTCRSFRKWLRAV